MASLTYNVRQGDTATLTTQLTDTRGRALDLTDCDVRFAARRRGGPERIEADAEVTEETRGLVALEWGAGDTDTAGLYDCEWEIDGPSGIQTVPVDGYALLVIREELVTS